MDGGCEGGEHAKTREALVWLTILVMLSKARYSS